MGTNTDIKMELTRAYRFCAMLEIDDLTYTHITVRAEEGSCFYILPFGFLFEEVTPDSLMKVDFDGVVKEREDLEYQYNKTAYYTHGILYKNRPEINAIYHLHTPDTVAVSAMECGLLPASQWALHMYDNLAYHDYNSLILDAEQNSVPLVKDLGNKNVMMMRNHGFLTCGKTLHEAFFYCYHLEQACKTQCKMLGGGKIVMPSMEVCKKTVGDLIGFEPDLGRRDWEALSRKLDRVNPIR